MNNLNKILAVTLLCGVSAVSLAQTTTSTTEMTPRVKEAMNKKTNCETCLSKGGNTEVNSQTESGQETMIEIQSKKIEENVGKETKEMPRKEEVNVDFYIND